MYKFMKFGTLWRYKGIPLYVGAKCITQKQMVWWWPINWAVVAVALPVILVRATIEWWVS